MADRMWVGTRKGLFCLERSGGVWNVAQTHFLGTQVPMLLPIGEQQVFAALKHGHFGPKLQRSDDGGANWIEVETPTYPVKPPQVPDVVDPMRNRVIEWSLEMMWSLESAAHRLWCGTLPGGLFSSDDAGQSWQLNMPLWSLPNRSQWFGGGYDVPGIHSICVDPYDAKRVSIAVSCGGVWHSPDNGLTWECRASGMRADYMPPERQFDPDVQDPHRMVQCRAAPERFWVQHHNGIFRSDDYCQSWNEITTAAPSGFGFAVAVHPADPDTAWFVPAVRDSDRYPVDGQFVVTRTRDGGDTFEVLREGLPQHHAYHLVYRHGLAINSDGSHLAMGSTSGGLWASRDGGDSWETISRDLPPIFAVRFQCE